MPQSNHCMSFALFTQRTRPSRTRRSRWGLVSQALARLCGKTSPNPTKSISTPSTAPSHPSPVHSISAATPTQLLPQGTVAVRPVASEPTGLNPVLTPSTLLIPSGSTYCDETETESFTATPRSATPRSAPPYPKGPDAVSTPPTLLTNSDMCYDFNEVEPNRFTVPRPSTPSDPQGTVAVRPVASEHTGLNPVSPLLTSFITSSKSVTCFDEAEPDSFTVLPPSTPSDPQGPDAVPPRPTLSMHQENGATCVDEAEPTQVNPTPLHSEGQASANPLDAAKQLINQVHGIYDDVHRIRHQAQGTRRRVTCAEPVVPEAVLHDPTSRQLVLDSFDKKQIMDKVSNHVEKLCTYLSPTSHSLKHQKDPLFMRDLREVMPELMTVLVVVATYSGHSRDRQTATDCLNQLLSVEIAKDTAFLCLSDLMMKSNHQDTIQHATQALVTHLKNKGSLPCSTDPMDFIVLWHAFDQVPVGYVPGPDDRYSETELSSFALTDADRSAIQANILHELAICLTDDTDDTARKRIINMAQTEIKDYKKYSIQPVPNDMAGIEIKSEHDALARQFQVLGFFLNITGPHEIERPITTHSTGPHEIESHLTTHSEHFYKSQFPNDLANSTASNPKDFDPDDVNITAINPESSEPVPEGLSNKRTATTAYPPTPMIISLPPATNRGLDEDPCTTTPDRVLDKYPRTTAFVFNTPMVAPVFTFSWLYAQASKEEVKKTPPVDAARFQSQSTFLRPVQAIPVPSDALIKQCKNNLASFYQTHLLPLYLTCGGACSLIVSHGQREAARSLIVSHGQREAARSLIVSHGQREDEVTV